MEAMHNFLNAVALNREADHLWEYLQRACQSMGRSDLVHKCENRDLDSFRAEFSFLDPMHMPKPNFEGIYDHPVMIGGNDED